MLHDYSFLLLRVRGDRVRLLILLAGLVVTAVLETVGIALVLPFVALLQRDEGAGVPKLLASTSALLGVTSRKEMVYFCGAFLVIVFLGKALFVLGVFRLQMRFVFRRMVLVMQELLASYVTGRPYTFHLQHNSAELVRNVVTDTLSVFYQAIPSLFLFAVEGLTCAVTAMFLIALEPVAVPIAAVVTGGVGFAIYRFYRAKHVIMGETIREDQGAMLLRANQALGGVKEALVLGRQEYFVRQFARSGQRYSQTLQVHRTNLQMPRLSLEALGVVGLVLLTVVTMARGDGPAHLVPMLGVLAIAVVRLIPSAARMVSAISEVRYLANTARSLRQDLEAVQPAPGAVVAEVKPVPFEREIRLVDLHYRYPEATAESLVGVSLTIHKGEAIAIVGGSGAGKTTLVDTLIGLLTPTRGQIEIDGLALQSPADWASWRRLIGYIPQQVYLCDDTIRRNIAFGVPDEAIDETAVQRALGAARLDELVRSLPDGLETMIGERGVRLSGGQRQRIGIARALYVDPQVLVLDEATSALDGVTEAEVVDAIERARKDRTLIVIAHRLSTVRNCDRLVFLSGGKVDSVGSWESLRAESADFRRMVELAGQ